MGIVDKISSIAKRVWFNLTSVMTARRRVYNTITDNPRTRAAKLLDIYAGNLAPYARIAIHLRAPRSAHKLEKYLSLQNIIKFAVDSIDAFRFGITVKTSDPKDLPIIQSIMEANNYDSLLRDIQAKCVLTGTMPVKVFWSDEANCVKLEAIPPFAMEVDTNDNDSSIVERVAYPKLVKKEYTNWETNGDVAVQTLALVPVGNIAVWTKDGYQLVGNNSVPVKNVDNPDNKNPYGVIPFVFFRNGLNTCSADFWMWSDQELESVQDELFYILTEKEYIKSFQSWSIAQLKGWDGESEIEFDPSVPLKWGKVDKTLDVGLEFVSPSPALEFLQDNIDKVIERFLLKFGLSPSDLKASRERSSAEALYFSSAKLEEIRASKKTIFLPTQKELWDKIRIVHNTHAEDGNKLSDADFEIVYYEAPTIPKKWDDKEKEYDWKLSHNLLTPVDIMVMEKDDVTPEQAVVLLMQNEKVNAEFSQTSSQNPSGSIDNGSPQMSDAEVQTMLTELGMSADQLTAMEDISTAVADPVEEGD